MDDLLATGVAVKVGLPHLTELYDACNHREERVVLAYAYILSWLNLRSALADDDHAGSCFCAISKLNPEVLRIRCIEVFC